MNKIKNAILCLLILPFLVYLIIFLFPQIVFGNTVEYKSFTVYSHTIADKKIFVVLDSAESLISASEFRRIKPVKYNLYLCSSFFEYFLFAPTQSHAFACNNFLTGNIIISKSNISQNQVVRNDVENNLRTLSGTIAHEITHSILKKHVGFLQYIRLDTWKKEGYSDFIATESSLNFRNGLNLLCDSQYSPEPSFKYFKHRLYIEYLIKDKKIPFESILKKSFSLTQLDKEIQQKYCR